MIAALNVCAQEKLLLTVDLKEKVTFASVDRPGDLYVVLESGEIRKFDKEGKQLGSLKIAPPDLFEAGDGTRSFVFLRDKQEVLSIAYDLSTFSSTPLHPEFAIRPWLVCPSRNEQWILDSADVSLKKTKGNITAVAYESLWASRPPDVGNIVYMREYLNFLFILEKDKGIHILNGLGKEVHKIEDPDISTFNFLGEELYYAKGQTLQFVDLYTTERREVALPVSVDFALLTDDRLIVVSGSKTFFYSFKP
jgi:hypothetical protein